MCCFKGNDYLKPPKNGRKEQEKALKTKEITEVDRIRLDFIELLKTNGYNLNNVNVSDVSDQVK